MGRNHPGKAGEVNFGIDLKQRRGTLHATLVNATDRQPFSSATWKDGVLTLRMDYYDGVLTAHYGLAAAHGRRVFAADQ